VRRVRHKGEFDNARRHYKIARRLASGNEATLIDANLSKLEAGGSAKTSPKTGSARRDHIERHRRRRSEDASRWTSTYGLCASHHHCHNAHQHQLLLLSWTHSNVSSSVHVSCEYLYDTWFALHLSTFADRSADCLLLACDIRLLISVFMIDHDKEDMFYGAFICISVSLSVCLSVGNFTRKLLIGYLWKFYRRYISGRGSDPDLNPYLEIFWRNFTMVW